MHRCWMNSPWMARDRWGSVPQGDQYWTMMTEPAYVYVAGTVAYWVQHMYEDCEDSQGNMCSICEQQQDEPLTIETPLITGTLTVFQGLLQKQALAQPQYMHSPMINTGPPLPDHLAFPLDEDEYCGPYIRLEDDPEEPMATQAPRSAWWPDYDGRVLECPIPEEYPSMWWVLPPWSALLRDSLTEAERDEVERDQYRLDTILFTACVENLDEIKHHLESLRTPRWFHERIAQQRADWIRMLEEVGDPCSYSQLQRLQQRAWA